MKKIFILAYLTPLLGLSQDRISRPYASLGPSLGILKNATGWCYNQDGRWVSGINKIPNDDNFDNSPDGKLGIDNFVYYEFRKIIYNKDTVLALLKKFKSGEYAYPSIFRGWRNYYDCIAFTFKPEDVKLIAISKDTLKTINVPMKLILGTGELKEGQSELAVFKRDYDTSMHNENATLTLTYQIFSAKGIARFFIYASYTDRIGNNSKTEYVGYNTDLIDDDSIMHYKKVDFTKFYYETTLDNFQKLFAFIKN